MFGRHQTENAALAVKAALLLGKKHAFKIMKIIFSKGLKMLIGQADLKFFHTNQLVVIDGAHNEEGVNALVEELNKRYSSIEKELFSRLLRIKNWIK